MEVLHTVKSRLTMLLKYHQEGRRGGEGGRKREEDEEEEKDSDSLEQHKTNVLFTF